MNICFGEIAIAETIFDKLPIINYFSSVIYEIITIVPLYKSNIEAALILQ